MKYLTRTCLAALAALSLTSTTGVAQASVDTYLPFHYVYADLQSGDYCVARHTMWAEIGIPAASLMEATARPVMVHRQGAATQVDISELSSGLSASYVADSIDANGVTTYEMRLDVTDLTAQNGHGLAGRSNTIETAKLYLIAMAANMEQYWPGRWRLRITFVGLPSQTGVAGTRLYATTSWPYTANSGLLAAYRGELLNRQGSCR